MSAIRKTSADRSDLVFGRPHSIADELAWLDSEGPTSPALIDYIGQQADAFDFFLFFSYRYYHAYHGVRRVPHKAILVPTAERDAALGLSIFGPVFRAARALMYNSPEERAIIQAASGNASVPGVVVGIGSDLPRETAPDRFRRKFDVAGPFVIYVGRIDRNKGCAELFDYFGNYRPRLGQQLSLILAGNSILPIPSHPRIRHLGFISDRDKFDAITASEALIMPSRFESLSMVALEAWGLGKPVLANGRCDVLRGQTIRSRAGLYYDDFAEFAEALFTLTSNRPLHTALGENGRRFYERHYAWPVIQRKYDDMLGQLSRAGDGAGGARSAPRLADPPAADAGAGAGHRGRDRQGPGRLRRTGGCPAPPRRGPVASPAGPSPRPSPVAGRQAVRSGPHGRGRRPQGSRPDRPQGERPPGDRQGGGRSGPARTASRRQWRRQRRQQRRGPGIAGQGRRRPEGPAGSPGRAPGPEPARPSTAATAEERVTGPAAGGSPAANDPAVSTASGPAVHQVLATLGYGDAIGHEVLGIQKVLRAAGYRSDIFVETADSRLEDLTRDYRELIDEAMPETVLIHHFSIGSRASRVAYALPGRMILVYHNITPPVYFAGVHPLLVELCYLGRRELGAYASRCALALGDSEFNRQELVELGFPRTDVLPVVPSFDHLDVVPDRTLAQAFDDGWTNLLFVGRVIPNKKIENVIRHFHAYKTRHNVRSRLLLVGSSGGFERYFAMLQKLIADLGAHDVHFLGHVSDAELAACYEVADLFLCASEHEGFCVPLMEAFHVGLPVVAYAATAIPATMDGGGVLYTDKTPSHVAAIVDAVLTDPDLEAQIVEAQDAALARLLARDFAGLVQGLRRAGAGDAAAAAATGGLRLLGSVRPDPAARGAPPVPPGRLQCAAAPGRLRQGQDRRGGAMIDQPVGAGRPPGRRHRRQRPAGPRSAAGQGPHLRHLRPHGRRRPARRRPAVRP